MAVVPFALATAALVTELLLAALDRSPGTLALRESLVVATLALTAFGIALRGFGRSEKARAAWFVLSLGILSYAVGFFLLYFIQGSLESFPTPADVCWLLFYPLFYASLGLLIRDQLRSSRRLGIPFDAAIIALAVAALGYELIFNGLLNWGRISSLVGGQLSYSVLDLTVLVSLVLIGAPSGVRIGRAYLLMMAGMLIVLASDAVVVNQIADHAFAPGTLLDAGWPAGMLLLGLASWLDTSLARVGALGGWPLYGSILGSFVVSFALLIHEAIGDQNTVVIVLAGAVPCLIVARLFLAVREVDRLASDNERIVRVAGAGIFRVDRAGRIVSVNPAAARMLGWGEQALLGRDAHSTMHGKRAGGALSRRSQSPVVDAIASGEVQRVTGEVFWRKDGTSFPVDYISSPIREGGLINGAVVVFDDVTHQQRLQATLRHQAEHDHLTGLHNRNFLMHETNVQLRNASGNRRHGALAILDVDAFKFVNDSFGHAVGDDLLRRVAAILRQAVRGVDLVARLGGDEFAILLREIKPADAVTAVEGLVQSVKRDTAPQVGAAAGVAVFDGDEALTADDLLICADLALYEAKQQGGGRVVPYTGRKGPNLTWVERIREAIARDDFVVYGQPIVDLKTGEVTREELLIRMRGERGDVISPAAFMPTAERFGLIGDIDRLMVAGGLKLAVRGRKVAVNLSARSLSDVEITDRVGAAVSAGLDPNAISFEITETSAAANMRAAVEFASRLERIGCALALDDFGTGFGSFAYLRHLPVQIIKVDIDFFRDLPYSLTDYHLVRVLVSLAGSLGQKVVAEGVEEASAIEVLRRLGVDYAQGHLIGRPKPIAGSHPPRPRLAARRALAAQLHD